MAGPGWAVRRRRPADRVAAVGRSAAATTDGGVHGFGAALTSFIGRAGAVGEVAGLLDRGRLVTVTGPGGAGKTRLAGQVARRVAARFADGVAGGAGTGAGPGAGGGGGGGDARDTGPARNVIGGGGGAGAGPAAAAAGAG